MDIKKLKAVKEPFYFIGKGPDSKSLLNRAWLVKSYFPHFKIKGQSLCDDIQIIEKAVISLNKKQPVFCGSSATALRFMALRVSREKGNFVLTGSKQLFARPHQQLTHILSQLGVESFFENNKLMIQSRGWQAHGDALHFSSQTSSQFASAVFLNGFQLERDLFISLEGDPVSLPYLEMTLLFLKNLGMKINGRFPEFHIPKNQKITTEDYTLEPDMSCLFSLACFSALKGKAIFTPWCGNSLQPDSRFPSILEQMGCLVERKNQALQISPPLLTNNKTSPNSSTTKENSSAHLPVHSTSPVSPTDLSTHPPGTHPLTAVPALKGIECNLNSSPDLFPSLAVLCALSTNKSRLYGISHLKYKETDRLQATGRLIQQMGRKADISPDELIIQEEQAVSVQKDKSVVQDQSAKALEKNIIFDPKEDHRMAMAGALLSHAGFNISIQNPSCVNKSFPEFWNIIH